MMRRTIALGQALVAGLVGPGDTFSQRLARGGAWVFISYGLEQALSLVRSIILARLLSPADFGLMGMVSLSIAFLVVLSETGVWQAIIQRPEVDTRTLNTAWLISVVRGILLALVMVAVAPLVALFFQAPLLGPMIRVMALSFVLSGLNSLGLVLLQKNLDFKGLTALNLVTGAVNLVVACVAAILWRNAWALVAGTLAGSVAALALSYVVHPFRPRWQFDRRSARELFSFGKYLTASSVVNYALTQGDDAYVGKVLGAGPLGLYELAYRLSNLPATSITHVIGRVTLPAYSALQNDLEQLRMTYLRVLKLTALVSIPAAAGLFALAPFVVSVLYGEKWMPMVPAFQVLCLFGLERSIGATTGPVFIALGKPNLSLRVSLVKLTTMAVCIVPLTKALGFLGTSIAVTLSAIAVQLTVIPVAARLLHMSWRRIVKPLVKPAAGSALLVLVLLLAQRAYDWPLTLFTLASGVLVGGVVYLAFIAVAEREAINKLLSYRRNTAGGAPGLLPGVRE